MAVQGLKVRRRCPFPAVCFHAQQCAEKYVKALLEWTAGESPRTHDLRLLMQLVPPWAGLNLDPARVVSLNRYAVETRYPGEWEPITRKEAEAALAAAKAVRQAVRRYLPRSALR